MRTITVIAMSTAIVAGATFPPAIAEEPQTTEATTTMDAKEGGQFKAKLQQFHKEQKEKKEAFRERMRQENAQFKQDQKEKSPSERLASLIVQCEKNYVTHKEFRLEQYNSRVEFMKGMLAERGITSEKQSEILALMGKSKDKATEHFDQQHKENIDFLNTLAKDTTLDPQQLKEKLKAQRGQQMAENKQFMEQLKTERKTERDLLRGEGKGSRKLRNSQEKNG